MPENLKTSWRNKPQWLTTGQASRLCSVKPDTLRKWIKMGRLEAGRTAGGHYRIEKQHLQPIMSIAQPAPGPSEQSAERSLQPLHCWEYMSERGVVRDDCKKCVVHRIRATLCFEVLRLQCDIGHAKLFCRNSCEDCVYYRRVNGLTTHVLVITANEELIECLAEEQIESVELRFARHCYEASASISTFRPAFVVVDQELAARGEPSLLNCLAGESRVPGMKIILAVPYGTEARRRDGSKEDVATVMIEKPFDLRRIEAVMNNFPVESLVLNSASSPSFGEIRGDRGIGSPVVRPLP